MLEYWNIYIYNIGHITIKHIWGIMGYYYILLGFHCKNHHSSGVVAVVSSCHHFSRIMTNMINHHSYEQHPAD